jgi:peroxiredoxin
MMGGFLTLPARAQFWAMRPPMLGKSIPVEVSVADGEGETHSLAELMSGQNGILFFWATWCPYCRNELKNLNRASADLARLGIRVYAVDIGESPENVQRFLREQGVDVDVLFDRDQSAAMTFSIEGLPTYLFIDEQGVVRDVSHQLPRNVQSLFVAKNS